MADILSIYLGFMTDILSIYLGFMADIIMEIFCFYGRYNYGNI